MNTMSAATCAAIAQIMPVLLVVLIAERVVVSGKKRTKRRTRRLIAAFARLYFDLVIAVLLGTITIVMLLGVENDGIPEKSAHGAWVMVIALIAIIVYRWWLMSPVGFEIATIFTQWYVTLIQRFVNYISTFSERLATVVQAIAEFIAPLLTAGIDFVSSAVWRDRGK